MIEFFFKHPIGAIGYAFLSVAIFSIWIHRKIWVWASLFGVSLAFATYGNVITLQGFIPLGILAGCYFFAKEDISQFWRLFASMSAAIITIALYTHFIKGFNNILLFQGFRSSPSAIAMNIYANYDKAAASLLILGIYLKVIKSKKELSHMLLVTVPWMILSTILIISLSQYLQIVTWDPKLPTISLPWLFVQLFFVVVPEEVFYRGFIQKEIRKNLNNRFSGLFAVLATSLLFSLIHLFFIPNLAFIACTFVMSLFYGGIYEITQKIESAIITHYATNICHFFFFTYPMLA
ncbi:MAG: CPBP family intramembrane metalloprotease [Chlamydiae bacterium]|nr:CPBP family intramembrane metalloprotease [Chlamydiota bacterium]